jgi:hypothetical protein
MTLQPRRVVEIAVYSDQHARGQHFYSSVLSLEIVVGSPLPATLAIGMRCCSTGIGRSKPNTYAPQSRRWTAVAHVREDEFDSLRGRSMPTVTCTIVNKAQFIQNACPHTGRGLALSGVSSSATRTRSHSSISL